MVFAGEDASGAKWLGNDGIRSMADVSQRSVCLSCNPKFQDSHQYQDLHRNLPADIVKASDFTRPILHDHKIVSSHVILHEVADIAISSLVRNEKPSSRKDSSPLELEDILVVVEVRSQGRAQSC